jgi:tRNA 2-thiouridine synthesizing protein A
VSLSTEGVACSIWPVEPNRKALTITMSEIALDLLGLKCPLPALKTRKALKGLASGSVLVVTANDPLAGLDIPNLFRETGDRLEATDQHGEKLVFRIVKA